MWPEYYAEAKGVGFHSKQDPPLSPPDRSLYVRTRLMWRQDCEQFHDMPAGRYLPRQTTQRELNDAATLSIIQAIGDVQEIKRKTPDNERQTKLD